jgi:double-stranded uracil-DNA glycosylase
LRSAKPPHRWNAHCCRDQDCLRQTASFQVEKPVRKIVTKPSQRTPSRQRLTDHIRPGVRILFVGINPGLRSAATGHHFAGHSNRFWKLLYESKLVSEPLTHQDDWRLPDWGLGLTNIIQRPSAGVSTLKPHEYTAGKKRLVATVKRYRPHAVALLGVTIYRTLFPEYRSGRISLGLQAKTLAGRPVFALPNPSGRNAHYSYRTMLKAFRALRNATDKSF